MTLKISQVLKERFRELIWGIPHRPPHPFYTHTIIHVTAEDIDRELETFRQGYRTQPDPIGYICEECFDAPAITTILSPYDDGDMGICATCVQKRSVV